MSSREIEEIKSKIDVAEFLGEYIKLIPAGATYKALCPFHNEKTPSLVVSPQKQIWRCFGCNEGGDIFSFLEKIEGVSFSEALKILANKAGVTLESRTVNKELDSHKERLYALCDLSSRYFHKVLLESSQAESARKYLQSRGVSDQAIMDFKIGYSIDSWDNLVSFLKKKGFSDKEIFSAGLSVQKNRGVGFYDRFRNRVMFPLLDYNNRTRGFSGRALDKDEKAKYINTPQTEIYNKSEMVFALNLAKREIKEKGFVVIVEGQMDAITCHQFGFKNTVASSGTALTEQQIQIIKRHTNNIYFALDADSAGQNAMARGQELINDINHSSVLEMGQDKYGRIKQFINWTSSNDLNLKVITIPAGKDPDECIKTDPALWAKAVESAQPVMDYYMDKMLPDSVLDNLEQKKQATSFILKRISQMLSKIDQDYWLKKLSSRVSIAENILWEEMKRQNASSPKTNNSRGKLEEVSDKKAEISKDSVIFKRLLGLVFIFPSLVSYLVDNLAIETLEGDSISLYKILIIFYNSNSDLINRVSVDNSGFDLFDSFKQFISSKEQGAKNRELIEESFLLSQNEYGELDSKQAKGEMTQLIRNLKLDYLNRKTQSLKREMEKAEAGGDKAGLDAIYQQINELLRQKNSIK